MKQFHLALTPALFLFSMLPVHTHIEPPIDAVHIDTATDTLPLYTTAQTAFEKELHHFLSQVELVSREYETLLDTPTTQAFNRHMHNLTNQAAELCMRYGGPLFGLCENNRHELLCILGNRHAQLAEISDVANDNPKNPDLPTKRQLLSSVTLPTFCYLMRCSFGYALCVATHRDVAYAPHGSDNALLCLAQSSQAGTTLRKESAGFSFRALWGSSDPKPAQMINVLQPTADILGFQQTAVVEAINELTKQIAILEAQFLNPDDGHTFAAKLQAIVRVIKEAQSPQDSLVRARILSQELMMWCVRNPIVKESLLQPKEDALESAINQ